MKIFPLIIAGIAGGSMALQGVLNSILGKKIGDLEAVFVVHVIGTVLLGAGLLLGFTSGELRALKDAPWYSYLGGPLNILIVWGVIASVSKVGAAPATTAILAVQISTALLLDCFGVTGHKTALTFTRILGAAIFIAGAYLLLRKPS